MKDNIAWMVELFLLVIILVGALALGIVSTKVDSVAAGVISIALFVICLAVGIFFAVGQDERLRGMLFGTFTVVTAILFTFYLTLAGVAVGIFSGLV